ncbi:methylase, partial [Escherichia marmotae]|nr:methylase [Escherichia marmotae]
VRIFVIDKVAGRLAPEVIQGGSIAELLDVLTVTPRLSLVADQPAPAPKRGGGISLFRAVKSAKPMPRAFHAAVRNHVLPVAYTRLETPAPLLEQTGVSLPYRPSRLVFDKAGAHP